MRHKTIQFPVAFCCPHCKSSRYIRTGTYKGIQRYKCQYCRKSFRDTTGTPLEHLHKKEKVDKYIKAMQLGLSVRAAAKYTGISNSTSFQWRHKFLSSLSDVQQPFEKSVCCCAAVITYPYSAKGRRKPPEKEQFPTKTLLVANNNKVSLMTIGQKNRTTNLAKLINKQLYSGYIATSPNNLLSRAVKKQVGARLIYNQNTLKKYQLFSDELLIRIDKWLQKFRGVASKYLQNYWAWFVNLERCSNSMEDRLHFKESCISMHSIQKYRDARNA